MTARWGHLPLTHPSTNNSHEPPCHTQSSNTASAAPHPVSVEARPETGGHSSQMHHSESNPWKRTPCKNRPVTYKQRRGPCALPCTAHAVAAEADPTLIDAQRELCQNRAPLQQQRAARGKPCYAHLGNALRHACTATHQTLASSSDLDCST